MYRRRRVGMAAPVPSSRRHDDAGTSEALRLISLYGNSIDTRMGLANTRRRTSGSGGIGASYISSSSDSASSLSSLSPSRSPPSVATLRRVTRSSRAEARRLLRSSTHSNQLDSTSSTFSTIGTGASSCSLSRSGLPIGTKPTTRGRRRAPLRSRLTISPDEANPPHTIAMTSTTATSDRTAAWRPTNNGVQDVSDIPLGSVQPTVRLRTTRSGRSRTVRANTSASQHNQAPSRSLIVLPRPDLTRLHVPIDRPQSMNTVDLQAVLNAVRSSCIDSTDDDCVICLDPKSNRSIVLPCMHTFCFDCIHRWLLINPSCPLCKQLAHRLIHSIMSDTDFTEQLVSELRARAAGQTHTPAPTPPAGLLAGSLSAAGLGFADDTDLVTSMDGTDVRENEMGSRHRQSHHHFHYHMEAPSMRFLNYLEAEPRRSPIFIPPILIPSDASSPASAAFRTDIMNGAARRASFRWGSDFGLPADSHRQLLTGLVNNAMRPRDSSLLDFLLLRQLVYILELDSVPVAEGDLERDIAPQVLASQETEQHRLTAFIRRELRVLAPWLSYVSSSENRSASSQRVGSGMDQPSSDPVSSAIASPLICGAPGPLSDVPLLDDLTRQVVQHLTVIPLTNRQALIDLLSSNPALAPPFIPNVYLEHFVSELTQFARYTGTLEQYDAAVCLYRRRNGSSVSGTGGSRRSDPRLAVYVGSGCWPRLRPGFSQPQGLVTHPLINWMLQRLFVHSTTGSITHPSILTGTRMRSPPLIDISSDHGRIPPGTMQSCHPNCSRLATLSRALLESLPSTARLHARTSQLRRESEGNIGSTETSNSRGLMTSAELFPNRLLFQRVLSELLDQARFGEALSDQFSRYGSQSQLIIPEQPRSVVIESTPPLSVDQHGRSLGGSGQQSLQLSTPEGTFQLLHPHLSALRRLNGLLLLFTAQVPRGAAADDDWLTELLHLPLLLLNSPPTSSRAATRNSASHVIDLTSTSARHADQPSRPIQITGDGPDWNFLRLLPSTLTGMSVNSDLTSIRTTSNSDSTVVSSADWSTQNAFPGASPPYPNRICPSLSSESTTTNRETGWRRGQYVVISSDSSSDEEDEDQRRDSAPYVLTADEEEEDDDGDARREEEEEGIRANNQLIQAINSEGVSSLENHTRSTRPFILSPSVLQNMRSTISQDDIHIPELVESPDLSRAPALTGLNSNVSIGTMEEPMEVDDRIDVVGGSGSSSHLTELLIPTGSKRAPEPEARTTTITDSTGEPSTSGAVAPKLARVDSFFADILLGLQRSAGLTRRMLLNHHGSTSRPERRHHHRHHHRHRTHRSICRSRSPIRLDSNISTTTSVDSDCEILRESIQITSDSSSASSPSHSICSTSHSSSSTTPRSRSPMTRRLLHQNKSHRLSRTHASEQHSHRRCRHHHHRQKHSRRHSCRCQARHRKKKCHFCGHKFRQRSSVGRDHVQPSVSFHTSPILISDDDDDNGNEGNQIAEEEFVIPTASSLFNDTALATVNHHHSRSPDHLVELNESKINLGSPTPGQSVSMIASTSSQQYTPVPVSSTEEEEEEEEEGEDKKPSSRTTDSRSLLTSLKSQDMSINCSNFSDIKIPIFEPSTANDFYHFFERLESSATSPMMQSKLEEKNEEEEEEEQKDHVVESVNRSQFTSPSLEQEQV